MLVLTDRSRARRTIGMLGVAACLTAMTMLEPVYGQTLISDQAITALENPQDATSIAVGPNVTVEDGGNLYVNTPLVTITGPFTVDEGGLFTIDVGYVVSVEEAPGSTASFAVEQNYPNPFYSQTEIAYSLPEAGHVEISIYNVLGQRVKQLVSSHHPAGAYSIAWDGRLTNGDRAAYGIYYYTVRLGEQTVTRQMSLVR